jgi:hypothetical protein
MGKFLSEGIKKLQISYIWLILQRIKVDIWGGEEREISFFTGKFPDRLTCGEGIGLR